MGEYVNHLGKSVKLGTCEDLYYITYGRYVSILKREVLFKEEGNLSPIKYALPDSGFRFRFPFPDEDKYNFGEIGKDNFERGLPVTIVRGSFCKKKDFPPPISYGHYAQQKQLTAKAGANPNNLSHTIQLEIVQQKLVTIEKTKKVYLTLVIRCPYSRKRWRIEELDQIDYFVQQIHKRYVKSTTKVNQKKFWEKVILAILKGYVGVPINGKTKIETSKQKLLGHHPINPNQQFVKRLLDLAKNRMLKKEKAFIRNNKAYFDQIASNAPAGSAQPAFIINGHIPK